MMQKIEFIVKREINANKRKSNYFGPYPNQYAARRLVNLLNRLYPLKKCKNFKDDLCLYYHIGECLGYCKLDIDRSIMDNMVMEITIVVVVSLFQQVVN